MPAVADSRLKVRTIGDLDSQDKFAAGRGYPQSNTLYPSTNGGTTPAPVEFTPFEGVNMTVVIVVTALTGTSFTAAIEGYDLASLTWIPLLTSVAITGASTTTLRVGPAVLAAANLAAASNLFETMRVRFTPTAITNLTMSVGGHLSQ